MAGRNGVSTHVTQSASFSLSPLRAGMSEGGEKMKKKRKEKTPEGEWVGGWVVEEGACLCFVGLVAGNDCVRVCGLLISYSVIRYVVLRSRRRGRTFCH